MKLSLLFLSIGFLLVLLQTTLLHSLPVGPIVPDLTLILCVYWALNRPAVSAVLGSFVLGYSVDVFSGPVLGVHAFAMSLVFLIVYLCSRYIWVHHPLLSATAVFFGSWVKAAVLVMVWGLMDKEVLWAGALQYFLLEALFASVLAPGLFFLLRRVQSRLEEVQTVS